VVSLSVDLMDFLSEFVSGLCNHGGTTRLLWGQPIAMKLVLTDLCYLFFDLWLHGPIIYLLGVRSSNRRSLLRPIGLNTLLFALVAFKNGLELNRL